MEIGYALSSEEHRPLALVENAVRAEAAGFPFALVSDHFHPWIDRQGQAPFVWGLLGGIAARTTTLRVGTGVTCYLHQVGPDQDALFRLYETEIAPWATRELTGTR